MSDQFPDYSGEQEAPAPDAMKRLGVLVAEMAQLELEIEDLEAKRKDKEKQLKEYSENLVPDLMSEIGVEQIKTKFGIYVEMKEIVRASFPKDEEKRALAFEYLESTGNDGIIKREVSVKFGRDSTDVAKELGNVINDWMEKHQVDCEMREDWSIHNATLVKFLSDELKNGTDVPLESFGAFVQKFAKIKRGK